MCTCIPIVARVFIIIIATAAMLTSKSIDLSEWLKKAREEIRGSHAGTSKSL